MLTKAPSRLPFTTKPLYSAAALKNDVQRLQALYASRGFPDARVSRVVADVDPVARTADVLVTIDEGPTRHAGRVSFEGFEDDLAGRLEQLPATVGFRKGAPLEHAWVEGIRDGSLYLLRNVRYATPLGPIRLDVGYQLTPIEGLVVRGNPEQRQWRVHFSIGQAF